MKNEIQAVFVARLTQDFGKCIGIEILQSLHKQGLKIVNRWQYIQLPCLSHHSIILYHIWYVACAAAHGRQYSLLDIS